MMKRLIVFTALLVCFILPAEAAELKCEINASAKKVTVTAKTSDSVEGKRYNIIFVKPEKDYGTVASDTVNDFVHYMFQGESGEDGIITHEFYIDENSPTGYYTTYLTIEGEGTETDKDLGSSRTFYADPVTANSVAALIENPVGDTDAQKTECVYNILENPTDGELNRKKLNIDEKYYSGLTDKMSLASMLAKADFGGTRDGLKPVMAEAVMVCALKEGGDLSEILTYYADELGYSDSNTYKKYNEYSKKSEISITDMQYMTKADVLSSVAYKLIMRKFSDILRWEQAIDVIKEFPEETQITFTKYDTLKNKQGAISAFLKAEKTDLASIKTVFDKYVEEYLAVQNQPEVIPPTGGGNSKGSKGTVTISPSPEIGKEENKTEDPIITTPKATFPDTLGHWAEKAINYLSEKEVLSGYEDGLFYPETIVTREQFVKMLVLAFDLPLTSAEAEFSDVDSDRWSASYINRAKASGIITGNPQGEFEPQREITRQEICVMTGRCLEFKKITLSKAENVFSDSNEVSEYAEKYVSSFFKMGIVNGVGENRFAPKDSSTRAMAAKIIYEALSRTEE